MSSPHFSVILADKIAEFIGSWRFIIIQSSILAFWVVLNADHFFNFDPYPFILLNLFLSFEAAYATPLILMSANRSAERDRQHMLKDLAVDEEANAVVKQMSAVLDKLKEDIRLDKESLEMHLSAQKERKEFHDEAQRERRELRQMVEEILKKLS